MEYNRELLFAYGPDDIVALAGRASVRGEIIGYIPLEAGPPLLPPEVARDTELLSQGFTRKERAPLQGFSTSQVKERTEMARKIYGVSTSEELVARAILNGDFEITYGSEPRAPKLTTFQKNILNLQTRGFNLSQIADEYGLTEYIVEQQNKKIHKKLNTVQNNTSANTNAIRRSFETGIFTVIEGIPAPEEIDYGMVLQVGDSEKRVKDVTNIPSEIDLLRLMHNIGQSFFTATDIIEAADRAGWQEDFPSKKLVGLNLTNIIQKLRLAFGEEILVKKEGEEINLSKKTHYKFVRDVAIGQPDNLTKITALQQKVRRRQKPVRSATEVVPLVERPKKEAAKPSNTVPENALPDLNDAFFRSLKPRDPSEVKDNEDIKRAIRRTLGIYQIDRVRNMVLALRFGVDPSPLQMPLHISRNGKHFRLSELIGSYVPAFQGLDLESASKLSGFTPTALLEAELKIIKSHQSEFPSLKTYIKKLEAQKAHLQNEEPRSDST
jgi:hypothetical protein